MLCHYSQHSTDEPERVRVDLASSLGSMIGQMLSSANVVDGIGIDGA